MIRRSLVFFAMLMLFSQNLFSCCCRNKPREEEDSAELLLDDNGLKLFNNFGKDSRKALLTFSAQGDLVNVNNLLRYQEDNLTAPVFAVLVNCQGYFGQRHPLALADTPLKNALRGRHNSLAGLLVTWGAQVRTIDECMAVLPHLKVKILEEEPFKTFIQQQGEASTAALTQCIEYRNVEVVEYLAKNGWNLSKAFLNLNEEPLDLVCKSNALDALEEQDLQAASKLSEIATQYKVPEDVVVKAFESPHPIVKNKLKNSALLQDYTARRRGIIINKCRETAAQRFVIDID